jgi:hypothetical protein
MRIMHCLFFVIDECKVYPYHRKTRTEGIEPVGGEGISYYKPTEEDQKYCKDLGPNDFMHCPRYRAYLDYLRAIG